MTKTSTKIALALMGLAASGMLLSTAAQARPEGMMGHGARPAFAELDTNGDGQISAEEFAAFRTAKFADADTNKDGALSPEEMIAHMEAQRAENMKTRMLERFDADKNGTISPEEMAKNVPNDADMIKNMDTDGNGTISAEEFAAMDQKMMRDGNGPRGDKDGKGPRNGCGKPDDHHGWGKGKDGDQQMPRCN